MSRKSDCRQLVCPGCLQGARSRGPVRTAVIVIVRDNRPGRRSWRQRNGRASAIALVRGRRGPVRVGSNALASRPVTMWGAHEPPLALRLVRHFFDGYDPSRSIPGHVWHRAALAQAKQRDTERRQNGNGSAEDGVRIVVHERARLEVADRDRAGKECANSSLRRQAVSRWADTQRHDPIRTQDIQGWIHRSHRAYRRPATADDDDRGW